MTYYTAAITLILIMDPLGNIPVFLSVLRRYDGATQTRIIIRETIIAFLILLLFLFFGRHIMQALHLSTSALGIAGGIILFLIALRMIFPAKDKESDEQAEEPFIVPLAVPLTAGPSAMAMVMLFVSRMPDHLTDLFFAVTIASVTFLIIMLCARYLMKFLGKRGLIAIERLMGMVLTTLAVQMFLEGLQAYLR